MSAPFGCALRGPVVSQGGRVGRAVDEREDFDTIGARANDIAGKVDAPPGNETGERVRGIAGTGRCGSA
ncbi:hypothetical protein [Burkholderia anthina]|uniref:Uncharacterized protein n=1 Tax=Burkholderia anthina TaxID=179879 RepID=A0ABS2BAH2_9BURK|nr:hypothetical protein [Burkholderia anthina]MBM2769997.1 hypothetical protein [Burkholderia anthina]